MCVLTFICCSTRGGGLRQFVLFFLVLHCFRFDIFRGCLWRPAALKSDKQFDWGRKPPRLRAYQASGEVLYSLAHTMPCAARRPPGRSRRGQPRPWLLATGLWAGPARSRPRSATRCQRDAAGPAARRACVQLEKYAGVGMRKSFIQSKILTKITLRQHLTSSKTY